MATKQEMVEAIDEALERRSRRRRLIHGHNEAMDLFVSCVGGLALVTSVFGGWFPGVVTSVLVAGILLSAVLALVINARRRVGLGRTLIELTVFGALVYGLIAGTFWYFMVHVASQPLFTFGATTTQQPASVLSTNPAAPAIQPVVPTAEPSAPRPVLQRGAEGAAVSELQQRLNAWIAATPGVELPLLPVNGTFGPRTETTVRVFQQATGLVVDGVVGPKTWGQLAAFEANATPAGE